MNESLYVIHLQYFNIILITLFLIYFKIYIIYNLRQNKKKILIYAQILYRNVVGTIKSLSPYYNLFALFQKSTERFITIQFIFKMLLQ